MVGDEKPPFSFDCGFSNGNETHGIVEEIQRSANQCVSRVETAARWLSRNRDDLVGPIIPAVMLKFGLTIPEAIEAIKRGRALRRGGANG